jgi:toxin ParE1/3/4
MVAQAAEKQLNSLEKAIYSLSEMSERFRVYNQEPWRSRNLRIMPVSNYLVFYVPEHEAKIVTVIRVIYDGRDIPKQLKGMVNFESRTPKTL